MNPQAIGKTKNIPIYMEKLQATFSDMKIEHRPYTEHDEIVIKIPDYKDLDGKLERFIHALPGLAKNLDGFEAHVTDGYGDSFGKDYSFNQKDSVYPSVDAAADGFLNFDNCIQINFCGDSKKDDALFDAVVDAMSQHIKQRESAISPTSVKSTIGKGTTLDR